MLSMLRALVPSPVGEIRPWGKLPGEARQPDSVSLQTKMQRIRVSIGWEGNSSEGNDFAEAAGSDAMKSINQGKKQTAHQETGLWK